jgi:ribosomal protein S8E
VGDWVYSVHNGAIVAVPIEQVSSTAVVRHHVTRVTLDTGAIIEMSPGHPTADGRAFGQLEPGDALDEHSVVVTTTLVAFEHPRTHDILPASDTGTYFAEGALVGSTLMQPVQSGLLR